MASESANDEFEQIEIVTKSCPKTSEESTRLDVGIQCDFPEAEHQDEKSFYIKDETERVALMRRMYWLVILQCHLNIPVILLCIVFIHNFSGSALVLNAQLSVLLPLSFYSALYVFRQYRRYKPYNYWAMLSVTLMNCYFECVYGLIAGTPWVIMEQLVISHGLLCIILYTRQRFLKLTQLSAVVIFLCVYGFYLGIMRLVPDLGYVCSLRTVAQAWYIVNDTKLMLRSHAYQYNLESDEHIYGLTNLYADFSVMLWRLFKIFVLNGLLMLLHFLRDVCVTTVA